MRLVFISDTHLRHEFAVPDGDALVHCGDFSMRGQKKEIKRFDDWLQTLPHPHKLVIAGNHELLFESHPAFARRYLPTPIYLQDSGYVIDGIKFFGQPWTPWFHDWAFNVHRGRALSLKWDLVPKDTDVLITHGPPSHVLDADSDGMPVGSEEMWEMLEVVRPAIHAFGHLHESHGTRRFRDTLFINAAICDDAYKVRYAPVVVDLDPATKKAIVIQ